MSSKKCLWCPFCWKKFARSKGRDFFSTPFPPLLAPASGARSSYHPNINWWKNGWRRGWRQVHRRSRQREGGQWCAIGRNRSRNTRISFRNLEGVCARSCSPRKYASSRCFGFVALARIIFDAARVSSRLENIRPPPFPSEFSFPTHPQLAGNNSTQRGTRDTTVCRRRRRRRREEGNETYLLQTCSFLIFLLPFFSITDDFMRC